MKRIDREGTFQATVVASDLATNKDNRPYLVLDYAIVNEKTFDGLADVSEEQMTARQFLYLLDKNGAVEERVESALMNAFGWDGHDVGQLLDTSWMPSVELVIEYSEWQGKGSYRVKWLNAIDGGGQKQTSEEDRKKILGALSMKFRARHAKPAPKPSQKPAPPAPPKPIAKPSGKDDLALRAWGKYQQYAQQHGIEDADMISDEYWEFVGSITGQTDIDAITAAQWQAVIDAIDIPF